MPDAPPTRSMLAAIGEVAAESAAVEQLMRDLFEHLIDSQYGAVIVAGEDLSRVCQLCMRVAQYNLKLTDLDVKRLGAITSMIDALRPERNFFVHSRWQKVSGAGMHVGIRSSRPSPRENGSDTSERYRCTPDDALEVAKGFRQVATGIEAFIELTFPDRHQAYPIRRTADKRMREFYSDVMGFGDTTQAPKGAGADPATD